MTTVSDGMIVSWLLAFVGSLMGLLIIVLAWIGTRIHSRLDEISTSLVGIEKDLRKDLVHLDRRVSHIEGVCSSKDGQ